MHENNRIQNTIDANLSGLYVSRCQRDTLLHEITGGKKMKRKITVGLVLVITLLLATLTALAVGIWHETADQVANLQAGETTAFFADWPTADKVKLVTILEEAGVFPEGLFQKAAALTADTMTADAQNALACDILTEWTAGTVDTVTLDSILETLNGPMSTWSMEDLVWYNGLLDKYGMLTEEDTAYILPEIGKDITQAEAVNIAKQTFQSIYGVHDVLDQFTVTATFVLVDYDPAAYEIAYQKGDRLWSVILSAESTPAEPPYYTRYHCDIRNDGEVLSYLASQQNMSPVRRYPANSDDLPEATVIGIAREAVLSTFNLSETTMDEYTFVPILTAINLMPKAGDPFKLGDRVWTVDIYSADAAVPTVDQPVFNVVLSEIGKVYSCVHIGK